MNPIEQAAEALTDWFKANVYHAPRDNTKLVTVVIDAILGSSDAVTLHRAECQQCETAFAPTLCIRCAVAFPLGSTRVCPRAADRGPHEAQPHYFKQGRLDGRCALPRPEGGSCGFERGDESVHFLVPCSSCGGSGKTIEATETELMSNRLADYRGENQRRMWVERESQS